MTRTTNAILLTTALILADATLASGEPAINQLEEFWSRDDGPAYLFTVVDERLVGMRVDPSDFGCRLALVRSATPTWTRTAK